MALLVLIWEGVDAIGGNFVVRILHLGIARSRMLRGVYKSAVGVCDL